MPPAPDGLILRPYQTDLLAAASAAFATGRRSVLIQLPTGAGKTAIAKEAARRAVARGKRVLMQAHARVLVDQIAASFASSGIAHGVLMAGRAPTPAAVQIGSVQTVARRAGDVEPFDLVISDESHRATSAAFRAVLAARPQAYHLGLSASPRRLDGTPLGDVFDTMVCGPQIGALIEDGHLAPFEVYAPTAPHLAGIRIAGGDYQRAGMADAMARPSLTGSATHHYRRLARDRQAIVYTVSIAHAEAVTAAFRAEGHAFAHLHSKMEPAAIRRVLDALRSGSLDGVVSVDMLAEGLDVPGVSCAILLRPTLSLVRALQMFGRCNRGASGTSALILDHAGVTARHGLPDEDQSWSLDGREKRARLGPAAIEPAWVCEECHTVNRTADDACTRCDEPKPARRREIEERAGELVRVERAKAERDERIALLATLPVERALAAASTPEAVKEVAKARGYKPGWAVRAWHERARPGAPLTARAYAEAALDLGCSTAAAVAMASRARGLAWTGPGR